MLVQGTDYLYILCIQFERIALQVFDVSLSAATFRDDGDTALSSPAKQYLGDSCKTNSQLVLTSGSATHTLLVFLGNCYNCAIVHQAGNTLALAKFEISLRMLKVNRRDVCYTIPAMTLPAVQRRKRLSAQFRTI
jgi:hypothetical protein